jgi:uroporphyrinogen-III synthase
VAAVARILVTRPQPFAAGTAARLSAMGHVPVLAPMLEILPSADVRIDLAGVAALALTSRTAVESVASLVAARPELAALFSLPTFTVGAVTAEAARSAGFGAVASADGDLEDLARLIRDRVPATAGGVLHLAGEDRSGDLEEELASTGHSVAHVVVYSAVRAKRLTDAAAEALASGGLDAALVYSRRTAQSFVDAVERAGLMAALRRLPCLGISVAALGPLIEARVRDLRAAAAPNENALFALLNGLGTAG